MIDKSLIHKSDVTIFAVQPKIYETTGDSYLELDNMAIDSGLSYGE